MRVSKGGSAAAGQFDFLFPDASDFPYDAETPAKLQVFQKALFDHSDPEDLNNSDLPPVFTYLGQFIDHDITHQVIRDQAQAVVIAITGSDGGFQPQPRDAVVKAVMNQRSGRLDLDCLYGPDIPTGHASYDKLIRLMRMPQDPAKMRLGHLSPSLGGIPDSLPFDEAADLPRLGQLMTPDSGPVLFSLEDFQALPKPIRKALSKPAPQGGDDQPDAPNPHAAVIGDARNDQNLFVAQLHVAFLRYHNRMVDALRDLGYSSDPEVLFTKAREQVCLHYQWLVLNVFLPAICDPVALQQVRTSGAAVYAALLDRSDHHPGQAFPIPIEFAVAGFRFGQSMVRGTYDWNSSFGHKGAILPSASFDLLFAFTGQGANPMAGKKSLPQNWVIDWRRAALPNSEFANRSARRIDTNVALSLQEPLDEAAGFLPSTAKPAMTENRNLSVRTLKRGIRMNLPSAQACIAALNAAHDTGIRPLSRDELTTGHAGQALEDAGFVDHTPLWFYTLKEAEQRHAGLRLGALGTHLVAGTIAGLIIHDPKSYWNRPGSHEGRWHPIDGVRASGQMVDSIPALLRAALLLEG